MENKESSAWLKKVVRFLKQLIQFFIRDIWYVTETELTRGKRVGLRFIKKVLISVRGFANNELMLKAASLTYYTLLAAVPIFALIVAIGRGFGFQDSVELFVVKLFSSQKELIPFFIQFVDNYLSQAKGGFFVGIGLAILLWSVMSMFRQVEHNFNDIWDVKKSRSIFRQFTIYISLILLVPILIAVSSGFTYYVTAYFSNSAIADIFSPILQYGFKLLPYVFYWIFFTFIFIVIPNTNVGFKHALLAGIVTGTCFQIFQYMYVTGQINLTRYNAVYGSFAAIPLFLFWLQISWVIVLYGAELTFASQNLANYNFEKETKNISRRYKDYTTLIIMKIIIGRFERGEIATTAEELSIEHNIPIRLVHNILKILINIGLVSVVSSDKEYIKRYQPAMDINQISVGLLMDRVERYGSENFKIDKAGLFNPVWKKLNEYREKHIELRNDLLIKDL